MAVLSFKTSFFSNKPYNLGKSSRLTNLKTYPQKIVASSNIEFTPIVPDHSLEIVDHQNRVIDVTRQPKRATVADMWREIHGQDDWVGMLDPFDSLLRSELIRYGDMAQACYDLYNMDPHSRNCGNCLVERSKFFEYLGWEKNGYEITKYIYTKYNINLPSFFPKAHHTDLWSTTASWVGYVAVSDDDMSEYLGRRDIIISWRGTLRKAEWFADLMDYQKSVIDFKIPSLDPDIKVHAGFLHVYTEEELECKYANNSARAQILAEIERLKEKHKNEELTITVTGHSLGSSLATLNAYDIAESGLNKMEDGRIIPVCVFSFSGPRVGNRIFKERVDKLGVKVLRVFNIHDDIPKVPGIFFNEKTSKAMQKLGELSPWCYAHIGEELALDHKTSPFLKEHGDFGCFHNLEAHLHLLAGYHGKGSRFWVASERDIGLVNKFSDFLKDEFLVPPYWWCRKNYKNSLVQ